MMAKVLFLPLLGLGTCFSGLGIGQLHAALPLHERRGGRRHRGGVLRLTCGFSVASASCSCSASSKAASSSAAACAYQLVLVVMCKKAAKAGLGQSRMHNRGPSASAAPSAVIYHHHRRARSHAPERPVA